MHPIHAEMRRSGRERPPGLESDVKCRRCGCWDFDACWSEGLGACWWAEADLCSHCAVGDWRLREITRRALAGAVGFVVIHEELGRIRVVEMLEEAACDA